jgi:hypothetical protein
MLLLLAAAAVAVTPEFCKAHHMDGVSATEPNSCYVLAIDCHGKTFTIDIAADVLPEIKPGVLRWLTEGRYCTEEPPDDHSAKT